MMSPSFRLYRNWTDYEIIHFADSSVMLHFEAPQEPSAVAELSVSYIRFFIGSSREQIGDQSRNACEQWLESRGARTKVQFLPSIRQVLPCGEVSGRSEEHTSELQSP